MLNTLRHSSQQTRFIVRPVHIGFVVYRVALCHISVRVLWFSCSYHSTNVPTSFIHLPSMLHHPNINTSLTIQNTKLSFRVCTHNPPPCPLQLHSVLKYFTILNFQPLLQKNCFQLWKQKRKNPDPVFTKFSLKIKSMNALINIFSGIVSRFPPRPQP